jgi:uncharacterized repeat protein (TIGR03803 family)
MRSPLLTAILAPAALAAALALDGCGGTAVQPSAQAGAQLAPATSGLRQASKAGKLTLIYSFTGHQGNAYDGATPSSPLVEANGVLYGSTDNGGSFGKGTIYKLTPAKKGYTESIIWNFDGSDGLDPTGPLYVDGSGDVFGTTSAGALGGGSIFELAPVPSGYLETVLHLFSSPPDGSAPFGGLVADSAGNLYGTTSAGGAHGHGTVFKLALKNGKYTLETIWAFAGGTKDGAAPYGSVIIDSKGVVYGTTSAGGAHSDGAVFSLTPSQNQYNELILASFQGGGDGANPMSGLVEDASGTFYGVTANGGGAPACTNGCGTFYSVAILQGQNYLERKLYTFQGGSLSANPASQILIDASGVVRGTASGGSAGKGTAYALTASGNAYDETVLYDFGKGSAKEGAIPRAGLLAGPNGVYYGTASAGGNANCASLGGCGTVFALP